jgi:hypothetical protein
VVTGDCPEEPELGASVMVGLRRVLSELIQGQLGPLVTSSGKMHVGGSGGEEGPHGRL